MKYKIKTPKLFRVAFAILILVFVCLSVLNAPPKVPYSTRSNTRLAYMAFLMKVYVNERSVPQFGEPGPFIDAATLARSLHDSALTQPPYGCPYDVNVSLSGIRDKSVDTNTIVAVEARPEPDETRGYACLSGTVYRVSEQKWQKIYRAQISKKYPILLP